MTSYKGFIMSKNIYKFVEALEKSNKSKKSKRTALGGAKKLKQEGLNLTTKLRLRIEDVGIYFDEKLDGDKKEKQIEIEHFSKKIKELYKEIKPLIKQLKKTKSVSKKKRIKFSISKRKATMLLYIERRNASEKK